MDEKPPIFACRHKDELACDDCTESIPGKLVLDNEFCDEAITADGNVASLLWAVNALRRKFDPIKFGAVGATGSFCNGSPLTLLDRWSEIIMK